MTTTETKERPILFSAPMVRAILDGNKTQTRRFVKITHRTPGLAACLQPPDPAWVMPSVAVELCPYGQPGDLLWVRENFYIDHGDYANGERLPVLQCPTTVDEDEIYYPADARRDGPWCCQLIPECSCAEVGKPRVRPSIHLPRWASRITLEITDVRAQRIQEISEEDAIAEGIRDFTMKTSSGSYSLYGTSMQQHEMGTTARMGFEILWDSINGKTCSWKNNPWCWAISFERIKP